ncbi:MAG: hypothetical protein PWP28_2537 [Oceanotoga sp.]|uniref:glycosyltransferase family 4 protein n=1 Tax=Oceanotoga sp. TaxID=2108366 RepID=UPI002651D416|nr:glycosyltransferase family 4 protein [Oceanotoga sp.]MDN5343657.1 hypothetical protein [Oceanotoga sp.]
MHVIFLNGCLNERLGGPAGYLAKLKKNITDKNITFIYKGDCKRISSSTHFYKSYANKFLKNIYNNKITKKLLQNFYVKRVLKGYQFNNFFNQLNSNEIKSIHFHSTTDLYIFNKMFPENKAIKILTSHSPELPADEMIQYYGFLNKKNKRILYNFFLEVDKTAFKLSDYIIFPSKNSMEPYYNSLSDFSNLIKKAKIKYLYTGTPKLKILEKKENVVDRYNLRGQFVVSYVGRHKKIKGYDLLQKAAEILWNEGYNISFLIAGKEEPIKGLTDKRWIEVGWTKDPGSLINASDVFVLPNRQTYFDLILLEVLSLGKPIIASNTGGNKDFFDKSKGVIPFESENVESLVKAIIKLYNSKNLESLGKQNLELYYELFTIEKMAINYQKLIREIYRENKIEVL